MMKFEPQAGHEAPSPNTQWSDGFSLEISYNMYAADMKAGSTKDQPWKAKGLLLVVVAPFSASCRPLTVMTINIRHPSITPLRL
jgi:hypothetical protein